MMVHDIDVDQVGVGDGLEITFEVAEVSGQDAGCDCDIAHGFLPYLCNGTWSPVFRAVSALFIVVSLSAIGLLFLAKLFLFVALGVRARRR